MVLIEILLLSLIYLVNFGLDLSGENHYILLSLLTMFITGFSLRADTKNQVQKLVVYFVALLIGFNISTNMPFANLLNILIYGSFLCLQFRQLENAFVRLFKVGLLFFIMFYNQFQIYKFGITGEADMISGFVIVPFVFSLYIIMKQKEASRDSLFWVINCMVLSLLCLPYFQYVGSYQVGEEAFYLLSFIILALLCVIVLKEMLSISEEKTFFFKLMGLFCCLAGIFLVAGPNIKAEYLMYLSALIYLSCIVPKHIRGHNLSALLLFIFTGVFCQVLLSYSSFHSGFGLYFLTVMCIFLFSSQSMIQNLQLNTQVSVLDKALRGFGFVVLAGIVYGGLL